VRLEGGNGTAGQGQFLTRILAQYPAILELATYLSLNKLFGARGAGEKPKEATMAKVAFFTFGILSEAQGHPQVQGFFDRIVRNFETAEQSDGFIDRSGRNPETEQHSWGEWVSPRFFREGEHAGDPMTLSLWEDLESVFAFAYSGVHAETLSRRKEWFLKPEWPTYVAWWVPDDHTPDWHEAKERHEHLHDYGPSSYAFDFKHPFGPDGNPIEIDRALVKIKIERNAGGSRSE